MPSLQSVKERREVASIQWGSDVLHVTYHAGEAGRLTQEDVDAWIAKGKELEQTGDEDAARTLTAEMVCRLARDWDLYEADPTPDQPDPPKYPLDVEHVKVLDFELNMSIVFGVVMDWREKKANGTLSRVLYGGIS